jgi:two-component system nitrogen regulation response regulator NtrX
VTRVPTGERAIDVVIVEDDEDARASIAALLVEHRCTVRHFGSAEEALVSSEGKAPDIVIADLDLGVGASGWILAEMLRRSSTTRWVGLIAMTGTVEPRMEVVRPFDAYLRKPVESELLLTLVRQLAQLSRAQSRGAPEPT